MAAVSKSDLVREAHSYACMVDDPFVFVMWLKPVGAAEDHTTNGPVEEPRSHWIAASCGSLQKLSEDYQYFLLSGRCHFQAAFNKTDVVWEANLPVISSALEQDNTSETVL